MLLALSSESSSVPVEAYESTHYAIYNSRGPTSGTFATYLIADRGCEKSDQFSRNNKYIP
jgi:hypothetical protein